MLVYEYEENNELIPELMGVELIQALIEELGNQNQMLINIFDSKSEILDVLEGRKQLTVEQEKQLRMLI